MIVFASATKCLSTLCLAIGLVAVTTISANAQSEKTVRISLVLPATGTQFGDRLRYGAEAAAALFDGRVKLQVTGPAQIDPNEQVRSFQNEVLSGPDAIIVGAIPAPLFAEPARLAESQDVKVGWFVVPPTSDVDRALFVGNDDYEMGRTVGNLLADRIRARKGDNPSGVVVPGICVPGLTNLEARLAGVREVLNKRLPKVTVATTIKTGNDRSETYAAWDQAIQSNPEALAFYDSCEPGVISLTKLKEDDNLDFDLVVWDMPGEVLDGVDAGTISAVVSPSHFIAGYLSVYVIAKALLEDRPVPEGWLRTPELVIDQSNVKDFMTAESSASAMLSFFQKDIDKILSDIPEELPSIENLRH